MIKFINLTPHTINIDGMEPLKSTGVARCTETIDIIGNIDGIDIIEKKFGELTGLPEPQNGTLYIVSLLCATVARSLGRGDCLIPGELVRNGQGQVIGCKNLARV